MTPRELLEAAKTDNSAMPLIMSLDDSVRELKDKLYEFKREVKDGMTNLRMDIAVLGGKVEALNERVDKNLVEYKTIANEMRADNARLDAIEGKVLYSATMTRRDGNMSNPENINARRAWTEEEFFSHTQWFHGTHLEWGQKIIEQGVNAKFNKGSELDFGYGFYLTPNWEWAKEYAKRTINLASKDKTRIPCVLEFELNLKDFPTKKHLFFRELDVAFADFVFQNRFYSKASEKQHQYDYVGGPMSDGKPIEDFYQFRCNKISKQVLYERILRPREDWQLLLRSQEICDSLVLKNVYDSEGGEVNVVVI